MAEYRVSRSELLKGIGLPTGAEHRVIVVIEAFRLEVESAFFDVGSSVFLPEVPIPPSTEKAQSIDFSNDDFWKSLEDAHKELADDMRTAPFSPEGDNADQAALEPGLPVIVAALRVMEQHPDYRLVVPGHADGSESSPDDLTAARAQSVVGLLEGKRDDFVAAAERFHVAKSDAAILSFAARTRGWPCAPADPQKATDAEVRAFQASYNRDFGKQIAENGTFDKEALGAYFDLCDADLARRVEGSDRLQALRKGIKFLEPKAKWLACATKYPIKERKEEGWRSKTDRRVEVLFFVPPENPDMSDKGVADHIYDPDRVVVTMLDRSGLAAGGAPEDEQFAIVDADPPPAGVGDPSEPLMTSMPKLQQRPDPGDQYAFLEPFDQSFPDAGRQGRDDGTAIA